MEDFHIQVHIPKNGLPITYQKTEKEQLNLDFLKCSTSISPTVYPHNLYGGRPTKIDSI